MVLKYGAWHTARPSVAAQQRRYCSLPEVASTRCRLPLRESHLVVHGRRGSRDDGPDHAGRQTDIHTYIQMRGKRRRGQGMGWLEGALLDVVGSLAGRPGQARLESVSVSEHEHE